MSETRSVASQPLYGVEPYAARPGVDVEIEGVGAAMRAAIWDLFDDPNYYRPEDIREVFETLFQDICIEKGYWQDADGAWHWLPDYVGFIATIDAELARERAV